MDAVRSIQSVVLTVAAGFALFPAVAGAQSTPSYSRKDDVIYGRKFGTALVMDVFTPAKDANGRGIVFCVSGGFFSAKEMVNPVFLQEFLRRGYTVFAVMHGSQPRFTIPEILDDMNRAVRYIRANAKAYSVDPDKLGIAGASAGGHLSLMQACAGRPGNPKAVDLVDRQSGSVACAACFFPPTDFLNYGAPGVEALGSGTLKGFKAPFDFVELNRSNNAFDLIVDAAKRREIGKAISPVTHVTAKSGPTLIIHGDADKLVPIQQAEVMIAKLQEAKVPCELVVRKGAAHGWAGLDKDLLILADWFDRHLRGIEPKK